MELGVYLYISMIFLGKLRGFSVKSQVESIGKGEQFNLELNSQ